MPRSIGRQTLPAFPAFAQLADAWQPVAEIVSEFDPYSDFNLTSLWCWGDPRRTFVTNVNGVLGVCLPGYVDATPTYSLLGRGDVHAAARGLLEFCGQQGHEGALRLVPETVAMELFDDPEFAVTEDRANHDYVIDIEGLANLEGTTWANYRRHVNSFANAVPGATVSVYQLDDPDLDIPMLDLFDVWMASKSEVTTERGHERQALDRLSTLPSRSRLQVCAAKRDGRCFGFAVSEVLSSGWAIAHFIKADYRLHEDVMRWLATAEAQALMATGATCLNYEQDLGLPGLRHSKRGLHPIGFLRKYTVAFA